MVSSQTIEVILRAKDQLTQTVDKVNQKLKQTGNTSKQAMNESKNATNQATQALNQQKTKIDNVSQQYNGLKGKVTSAFNSIKNTINNTKPNIDTKGITSQFNNTAETIKNKWRTVMQHIQSNKPKPSVDTSNMTVAEKKVLELQNKIKQVNNIKGTPRFDMSQVTTADGQIKVVLKDLQTLRNYPVSVKIAGGGAELNNLSTMVDKVQQRANKLNNTKVDLKISNAGLSTLNGQITTTTDKVNTMGNALIKLGNYAPTLASKMGTAFANIQSKVGTLKNKLGTISSSMSMLSGTIMSAFGVVGVTSLSQFTIGAAIARQKLNAVTTSITGSEQATKSLNSAISKATSGGIMGFTKVAQAVQQIGIKYQLSNKQLEATAPVLNKIGTLARAMGKDGETAANLMSKAYDGLNGNFMLLKRNLGITKEQLIDAGWSGAATDVDGYTMALQKVLDKKPEMQEYLNSYEGQMERLQLAIQGVGREIGEIFLPILNMLLGGFLELHKQCPWLTTALVVAGIAFVGLASAAMILLPIIELLTIEIGEVTIAQRLLNLTILQNPYVWVAVAIIALVAVMWHLYNTNESVRKAFDHMGQVINNILVKAWETLQKIIEPLYPTFEHLVQVCQRLWTVIFGAGDATDQTGEKMDTWGVVANALAVILQELLGHIVTMVEFVVAILVPALNLVINILSAIINFVTSVIEAFSLLAQGDFAGFIQTFLEAFGTLETEILTYLGQFVIELLNNIGTVLFGADAQFGTWLYNFILNGVNGAIQFVTGFISGICQLPGLLMSWLWQCLVNTGNWIIQMKDKFVKGATDAVNGFIQWISTLPGKLWTWLWNTIEKVIAWATSFKDKVRETAKGAVDKFKEKLKLNKVVQDEINYIADCLKNAVGWLGKLAWDLAKNIWQNFKDAFKQKSPGLAAKVVINEVGYMKEALTENQGLLSGLAQENARAIIDGFTNEDVNSTMLETLEDCLPKDMYGETMVNMNATEITDDLTQTIPVDTLINTDMSSITTDMLNMTSTVNPELATVTNSLNNMGNTSTQATLQTLQNNQSLINGYNQMRTSINQSMNQIQQANLTGWNNVKNVTTTSLNSMLSSTKSVTAQMVSAWQTMKNSIIQAANDIKTQSSSRFDSLWSTIKTFYHRIQHPGGAGAPTGRTRRTGGSNGFKTFSNSLRNVISNKTVNSSIGRQDFLKGGLSSYDIKYILPNGNSRIGVKDVQQYIEFMLKAGAGGWSSVVSPNVKWIRQKTNEWKTAPPTIINKYKTSKGFRVGDFENGEPNITFSDFRQMAEDVFSQCHYEFYWDSERYGNWISAFHNGGMNCSDSTDALIAMAHACGLSASKVHGHWNSYGHYWAEVAGHKMDTTGWMNQRNWTPSASHAGPVPHNKQVISTTNEDTVSIIDILLEIIDILRGNKDNNITVVHEGKVNYEFTHDITGELPDNLSAEEVERIMDAHMEDSSFLRRLANNREFQERFNNMSQKLLNEKLRFS